VLLGTLRRLKQPILDFLLAYFALMAVAAARSAAADAPVAPLYLLSVAPGYALAAVLGIAAAGGYRPSRTRRLRPVVAGASVALLFVAAVSFFVRDIAFSRVVVLAGFPMIVTVLAARRLLGVSARRKLRRALLVGSAVEAERLQAMLVAHPRPPFELAGYVAQAESRRRKATAAIPSLGKLRHVRDLVRLHQIDDVVFAGAVLSNRTIFQIMQQLRDLPVQFRMLAEGRKHIIGKASIDDLSLPSLLEADEAFGSPRSPLARRAFEVPIAITGLVLYPLVVALSVLAPGTLTRLRSRMRLLPSVISGRRGLIGYDPDLSPHPPPELDLKPGVFPIAGITALNRDDSGAYWYYFRHQSASLDWELLLRSLRDLRASP
jgi:O-antigen biosynthesis protein